MSTDWRRTDRSPVGRPSWKAWPRWCGVLPTRDEPLTVLRDAGFVGLEFNKLGDCGCLEHDGIGMREVRLSAYKPEPVAVPERNVLYKGPFAQTVDDQGRVFPRGRPWQSMPRPGELLRGAARRTVSVPAPQRPRAEPRSITGTCSRN